MTEQEEKAIIELLHSPDDRNNALGVQLAANTLGVKWICERTLIGNGKSTAPTAKTYFLGHEWSNNWIVHHLDDIIRIHLDANKIPYKL